MVVGSGKLEKAQSGSEKAGEGEGVAARTGQALGAGMEAMQGGAETATTAYAEWFSSVFSFIPKFGLPSSHHFDPVLGIDTHLHLMPAPSPIPDPFIGIVFDAFDYAGDILSFVQSAFPPAEDEEATAPVPDAGKGGKEEGGQYPSFPSEPAKEDSDAGPAPGPSVMGIASAFLETTVKANGRYRTMAGTTSKNPMHLPAPPWGESMEHEGESFVGSATGQV